MDLFPTMNIVDAVIDEIALEGLDGITLEGTDLLSKYFFCIINPFNFDSFF